MRIAMIIARYPPEQGGTEIQCQRLSEALARRGHEVVVLTEKRQPELPYEEFLKGVRVIRMPTRWRPPWSSFHFVLKLAKYLHLHPRFEVLHVHMIAMPAIFALAWSRWRGIPVLIKTAGAGPTGDIGTSLRLWRGRLKLRIFRNLVRLVVAPSGRARQELLDVGVPADRVRLIPNGVDFGRFRPATLQERRQARDRLTLSDRDPVAIFAGRWAPGKNVEMLMESWEASVAHDGFRWKLILAIAGNGISASTRERLGALEGRVRVFENVGDLSSYYHAADLAVLPSIGEGLSNFLLEAMACGLPTLTSESAAVSPASDRDRWGWVIPDDALSAQALTNVLVKLSQNFGHLISKGIEARRQVAATYSLDAIAQAYETLYHRSLC